MDKSKELIVIAGPTASGKTNLAIELALKHNCEIFSADSRQIYKELNIGVAKPSQEELIKVKHNFINHISIHENYNVGKYEDQAINLLNNYFQNNDKGILVGGTGLYIKAIIEGLDEFPKVEEEIISLLTDEWIGGNQNKLLEELKEKDLESFENIDIQNSRRIIRALSIIRTTGKKFSFFKTAQTKSRNFVTNYQYIDLPRNELYCRINERVDKMIVQGLIDEVKELYDYKHLQALQTVGYSELFEYLDGLSTLENAIDKIKQHSRNYAKRQMTWFRKFNSFTPG